MVMLSTNVLQKNMIPKNWLTVAKLREYVEDSGRHWSRTYVQFLIANNKLKSFKVGAARIFLRQDVDTYISSLKRKSPPILVKKYA